MTPTTEKQLYALLGTFRELMPKKDFSFDRAYGCWKLVSHNQSHNESGFLSKPALYEWMQAYKAGYYAAQESK